MPLLHLPVDLILVIADHIDREKDILALIKSSRCLHNSLISYLYWRNSISGASALPWSAEHGFEQNVKRMLRHKKVDPDTPRIWEDADTCSHFPDGDWLFYRACNTPLYLASQRGHENIVKLLLQCKVDLSLPLIVAASEGNFNPIYIDLPKREEIKCTPEGYEKIVRLLLEHGANPNSMTPMALTAVKFGIRSRNLGIVRLLLEYGAKLDHLGHKGRSGLSGSTSTHEFIYAMDWHLRTRDLTLAGPLFELMMRHGADVKSLDSYGVSPLHLASRIDATGHIVRQIIQHGANVNFQSPTSGSTPLHDCTEAAALALLDKGARVDIANVGFGNTPLHCTTDIKVQRLILDAGANPNWKNHNKESVLVCVAGTASSKSLDLLFERGADINSTSFRKTTALHVAVEYGNAVNVRWLLDHGANVNAKLDTGETPLDLACSQPAAMTLTRGHSCVLCQQRKVRCDRQKPCANCVKAQVECRVAPSQTPRRRTKRPQELYLIQRLKKYEAYMSQHGLDPQSIGDSEDDMEVASLENELGELKASLEENAPGTSPNKEDKRKLSKWFAYYKEYRSDGVIQYRITHDMLHDLIEDEYDRPIIHHAFDVMFENNDSFPFSVGGSPAPLAGSHPSAIQIFQLWQVYINNVNPLLKINHVPTLQSRIVKASADTANVSKPFEALMFAIYFISVHSMSDEEAESTLGEDKKALLGKYHQATQQALINAGFMKSNELVVLQAYLLYLLTTSQYVDPRSLFCLIGIAVRIATRLGLHKDGGMFGLAPFESELRKRLWWQIVTLDQRIAGITGTTITALSSIEAECPVPLNVNDTSLHTHAKQPPAPEVGATEMTFCLTRIDFALASNSNERKMPPVAKNKSAGMSPSPSLSSAPKTNIPSAIQGSPKNIESYCAHIEHVYLRHCDPNIGLQFFALMTARISMCNLHIADFLRRGVPVTSLDEQERKRLFITAIQMLEYDNITYTTDIVRNFLWYTHLHIPVLGYAFLVNELHYRNTGELCERAWTAICTNHENRSLVQRNKSPMHIAFSVKLIKAWDAHCDAERQLGRVVQSPPLLKILRERYSHLVPPQRTGNASATDNRAAPAGPSFGVGEFSTGDPAAGTGSIQDSSTMFSQGLGGIDMAYDTGYEQMDWTQLMQLGAFESFGSDPGSMFNGGFHNY